MLAATSEEARTMAEWKDEGLKQGTHLGMRLAQRIGIKQKTELARISHKQCDHNLYNPYRETVSGIFHGVDFLCNMETQNPVLIRV